MRMLCLISLMLGAILMAVTPAAAAGETGESQDYGVMRGPNGEVTSQTTDLLGVKRPLRMQRPSLGRREKATPANPIPAWVTADSRPLLAIGTIAEFNATSGTLMLNVDREHSKLPNAIRYRATEAGALEALQAREFPLQRMYRVTTNTVTYDARLSHIKPPTRAETGNIANDAQRLPRSAFGAGKRVSVLYRLPRTTDTVPVVINMSLLDADQQNVRLDYNPVVDRQRIPESTTATLSRSRVPASSRKP